MRAAGRVVAQWAAGSGYNPDFWDYAKATRSSYDAAGNLISVIEPGALASQATTTTYSPSGLVLRTDNPDGSWAEFAYDDGGLRTSETRPGEGGGTVTVTTAYDLGGRAVSVTDEAGAVTDYRYDLLDRQIAAGLDEQPGSAKTYNTAGWTLSERDADGILTSFAYDPAGRVLSETKAGGTTESSYDDAGRPASRTDPAGRTVNWAYDAFGSAVREWHTVSGATIKDTRFEYDSQGRMYESSETAGAVSRTTAYHGVSGKPAQTLLAYAGTSSTVSFAQTDGAESGRSVSTPAGALSRSVTARDAKRRATSWSVSGAGASTVAFDAAGRIAAQHGLGFAAAGAEYDYDPGTGRKSAESVALSFPGASWTSAYTYTESGRLATASIGGSSATYGWDLAGNLTEASSTAAPGREFRYDAANRLTAKLSGVTTATATTETVYAFDPSRGHRTYQSDTDGTGRRAFGFDDAERLASYSADLDGDATSETAAAYGYDGFGQRTLAVLTQGSATTTTTYTYEGLSLLALAAERTEGTAAASWSLAYLYGETGRPFAAVYSSSEESSALIFHLVVSDRGDVLSLLDASGASFARYGYDAFGNPAGTESTATALIPAALAAAIAERQPLRYAGYLFDEHSGLYYLSQRYYDPATYQFLSKDPARDDGEESAYQYCGGDPVGKVDPSGEAAAWTAMTTAKRDGIRNTALKWVNKSIPYLYGAKYFHNRMLWDKYQGKFVSEYQRMDCSAFVQQVLHEAGVSGIGSLSSLSNAQGSAFIGSNAPKQGTSNISYFDAKTRTPYRIGDVLYSSKHIALVISNSADPEIAECTPWKGWKDGTKKHRLSERWSSWAPTKAGRYIVTYSPNLII